MSSLNRFPMNLAVWTDMERGGWGDVVEFHRRSPGLEMPRAALLSRSWEAVKYLLCRPMKVKEILRSYLRRLIKIKLVELRAEDEPCKGARQNRAKLQPKEKALVRDSTVASSQPSAASAG